jgi:hypothetical protein
VKLNSAQSEELQRIRRVADMLCTGHAVLRDRYTCRALVLDILTLLLSTWVVALAFVSPPIATILTPFGFNTTIWLGTLSAGTFFLTLLQLKTDWKSKADAHRRTLDLYAEVKREASYLLASDEADDAEYRRILARYDLASAVGIEIPEGTFLSLKKRHKLKLLMSKTLDTAPASSLLLLRVRLWVRDNHIRKEQ